MTEEAILKEKGPLLQEIVFRQGDNLQKFFAKTKLKSLLIPCSSDYSDFFKLNKEYTPETLIDFYKKSLCKDLYEESFEQGENTKQMVGLCSRILDRGETFCQHGIGFNKSW